MGFFGFGKRHKPKKFGYIPMYYDKDKEDLEDRLSRYSDKKDVDQSELVKRRISSGFKSRGRADYQASKKANRSANIRLIIIILFLGLLSYKLLNSEAFLEFMQSFMGTTTPETIQPE